MISQMIHKVSGLPLGMGLISYFPALSLSLSNSFIMWPDIQKGFLGSNRGGPRSIDAG
jgi:hypothetical protein